MDTVLFLDTTLRDGEQTPGVSLNLREKLEIAHQLENLNVDIVEAGFPASSPGDFKAVQEIAKILRHTQMTGFCRALQKDIDTAAEALRDAAGPILHIVIATSPLHMEYKLKMKPEEVLQRSIDSVRYAKRFCQQVQFSPEDASRSELSFLYTVLTEVVRAGATVLNITDTVGYSTPTEFFRLVSNIRENVPGIEKTRISVHCHNDMGMATANTLAGVAAGARQVECTINGLGERAGNASLEELAMALYTRRDFYGLEHQLQTKAIYRASRTVAALTGIDVPMNKPVVGQNAFRHESGIHQHGVLNNRQTYEVLQSDLIGVPRNDLVLGKLSGRHAFSERLQSLGYSLSPEDLNRAFLRFKELADQKKEVTDDDLEAMLGGKAALVEEPIYTLETFLIQSGSNIVSTASVQLWHEGALLSEAAVGDGPVDALFRAVDRIVGNETKLESYSIKAVTGGTDALGEVTVRVSHNGISAIGRGLSTDVIESSLRAYIHAINRALTDDKRQESHAE